MCIRDRYRPSAEIIAMTPFKETCRQLGIVWGVQPLLVKNYNTSDDIPLIANEMLTTNKNLRKNVKICFCFFSTLFINVL